MVLLHDVVEIFDLSNHFRDLPAGIDFINRSFVGATSMVTFSGTSLSRMALSKKRLAAALSRFAVKRKSSGIAFF